MRYFLSIGRGGEEFKEKQPSHKKKVRRIFSKEKGSRRTSVRQKKIPRVECSLKKRGILCGLVAVVRSFHQTKFRKNNSKKFLKREGSSEIANITRDSKFSVLSKNELFTMCSSWRRGDQRKAVFSREKKSNPYI